MKPELKLILRADWIKMDLRSYSCVMIGKIRIF